MQDMSTLKITAYRRTGEPTDVPTDGGSLMKTPYGKEDQEENELDTSGSKKAYLSPTIKLSLSYSLSVSTGVLF